MISVNCSYCNKLFYRPNRRYNEAIKFGWNQYCTPICLRKAKNTSIICVCSRKGCGKTVIRAKNQFDRFKVVYCSHRCSALVSNFSRRKIRICLACKKEFTGSKRKFCSSKCFPKRVSKYTKEFIVATIRKFVRLNKRIPVKRELNFIYQMARRNFGTWNNTIKSAGFDPNPVMFANKHIAKDGHKCDSFTEKIIDDWLSTRGINHKRSFPYPGDKGFTCDFIIGNKWVEFFGLSGELHRYDTLMRRKLKLVKKYGIELIKIYPKDVFPISNLKRKLSFLNNSSNVYKNRTFEIEMNYVKN